jgi:hypothetical protein
MLFRPPHVDSCGSDRHRRLPAPLEASASGPAAPRAPAASPQAAWRSGVGGGGFHVNRCRHASPPPLHVDSCGSDRPRRLPAPLEASASGPAAPRAPAASPQAAWRSGVGGGGFHVNRCRHASPPPLHVDSCGSDRPRRLPAPLEASDSGPAAPRAPAASPQAAWRSGVGGGGFHVNRWLQ